MSDDNLSGSSPEAPIEAPVSDVSTPEVSSTPDTGEQPTSMLDAVTAALHPKEGDAEPPPAQTEGKDAPKPPSKDDEPLSDEVSEEELRAQKPQTAKRIRQLLGKISERETQLSELRPKAEAIDQLAGFLRSSGVGVEDLNAGVEIMALIRHDPVRALEKLAPTIQFLQQFAGQVLPQDLDEKVRQGFIDEATARELAFRRNNERLQAKRVEDTHARQAEEARLGRLGPGHPERMQAALIRDSRSNLGPGAGRMVVGEFQSVR